MSYLLQRLMALFFLLLLAPVMCIIALLVVTVDGRPVFFRQERVGRNKNPFTILKFRTMVRDADALLEKGGVKRLTRTGGWLRRSSLDELPQLVNVVRGEMALIGPRACLPEVAANIPERFRDRWHVLPGITGLAQISGRNTLPWSDRLRYDAEYARNRSWRGDLEIVVKTVLVVVGGRGFAPDRTTHQTDDLGLLGRRSGRGGSDE